MKKLMIALSTILFLSSAVFASGRYHGDIQFHTGGTSSEIYLHQNDGNDHLIEKKYDTKQIGFEIATWHMWDLNNCFSLGFVTDIYGGFGSLDSWSAGCIQDVFNNDVKHNSPISGGIFIGPAFGIQIWKLAKLSLGVGVVSNLSVVYDSNNFENFSESNTAFFASAGIGADLQLKLFPTSFFSPLIGYRCSIGIGGKCSAERKEKNKEKYSLKTESDLIFPKTGTLYFGFSFNW